MSLLTGYVSSYGTVRTFIKPTDPFFQQTDGITVIDADLKMYADIVRTPPDIANLCLVTSDWSEGGLTWNNQPTWSSTKDTRTFNDDAWVNFQVADEVDSWIQGTQPNYGFMVWSTATTSEYTLWSSSEAASKWPQLVVRYAVEPTIELVSPNLDVPAVGAPFAEWEYSDLAYLPGLDFNKEQVCYTVELASVPDGAALWSCTESTSDTRCEITYAGFTLGTRYWVRVRAAGGTLDAAHPYAWSDWTEWQPFWYRSADDVNDQAGVEAYRAADEVASGVWVDLPSGSLRIARSEWLGPSLGPVLSVGSNYDSSRSGDTGMGEGWRLDEAQLSIGCEIIPEADAGFERDLSSGIWHETSSYLERDTSVKRSGEYSLRFYQPSSTYVSAVASTSDGSVASMEPVSPGQRLRASAWIRTAGLSCNRESSGNNGQYGPMLTLQFYDGAGVYIGERTSRPVRDASGEWTELELETSVPDGAYLAKLNLEVVESYGTVYFDDVSLDVGTASLTDADGTLHTMEQVGDGVFARDPLADGVFDNLNVDHLRVLRSPKS